MTISTVLTLVMYLLYLFGMNFPNIPKVIMSTHVPSPNANIEAAPDFHEPEAAANIHITVSAPHGISPVSSPTMAGPLLNLHGFVSCGLMRLREPERPTS